MVSLYLTMGKTWSATVGQVHTVWGKPALSAFWVKWHLSGFVYIKTITLFYGLI